jgi:predicted permease
MFNALIPVFCLILLGAALHYGNFPGREFWAAAEKLTYYLLFPSLLFVKLSSASLGDFDILGMTLVIVAVLLTASVLLFVAARLLNMQGPIFTSVYQGGIRFNTYVGLAAVNELQGNMGIAAAAVALGIMIPLVNLLVISVFAIKINSEADRRTAILRNIIKNPLIFACVLGIAWSRLGIPVPETMNSILILLSGMALPLGLLAVGAGLNLRALSGVSLGFGISSAVKLLGIPVMAYGFSRGVGLDAMTTSVLVTLGCLPTASSAYILARQLNGDAPLMAAVISGQTLLAMLTMPLMLTWLS